MRPLAYYSSPSKSALMNINGLSPDFRTLLSVPSPVALIPLTECDLTFNLISPVSSACVSYIWSLISGRVSKPTVSTVWKWRADWDSRSANLLLFPFLIKNLRPRSFHLTFAKLYPPLILFPRFLLSQSESESYSFFLRSSESTDEWLLSKLSSTIIDSSLTSISPSPFVTFLYFLL